jgi:mycofactocin system glycosyltransferase
MKAGKLYIPPEAGCYRRARGLHFAGNFVICDYPLRIVRPGAVALRLLELCESQRTADELAETMHLPVERVKRLCEQLRWKGLLEVGAALPPETWPGVSIIIPSYNRVSQLERCLRSLLHVDYPPDRLEIIVVDDASSDGTQAMIERLSAECVEQNIALRSTRQSTRQGVAMCRNRGAELARHELLAFLDSDCVASARWLAELVPDFSDSTISATGGMIRAYERRSTLGRYEDTHSSLFMGRQESLVSLDGPLTYLPTANLLVRQAAWKKVGVFAPLEFGEDVDFCRRLLLHGARIHYLPRGLVEHDYRATLPAFLRTRVSYASSEAVLLRLHPATRRVLLLPPEQASFAALLIGGVWGLIYAAILALRTGATPTQATTRPPGYPQGVSLHVHKPHPHHTHHDYPPAGRGGGINKHVGIPLVGIRGARAGATRLEHMGRWSFIAAIAPVLFGAARRFVRVRRQGIRIHPLVVLRATVRAHLAYTYYLCRHLTRYYTLPMLLIGLIVPPLLLLALILCGIVIGVDYARLRPQLSPGRFALYALLDDCAYEIGVALGCIKQRTWKPLLPVVRRKAWQGDREGRPYKDNESHPT